MSQLMLLGQGNNSGPALNEVQRQDMLESIKKIVEKPIQVRNETHVSYIAPQPAPAPVVNEYESFPQA